MCICTAIERRIETARLSSRVEFLDLAPSSLSFSLLSRSVSNWTLGKFLISTTEDISDGSVLSSPSPPSALFALPLRPAGGQLASYADQIAIGPSARRSGLHCTPRFSRSPVRPSVPPSVRFPFHLAAANGRTIGPTDGRTQLSGEKVSKAAIQADRTTDGGTV